MFKRNRGAKVSHDAAKKNENEQIPSDQGIAQSAQESANAEAIPPIAQEAPGEVGAVSLPEQIRQRAAAMPEQPPAPEPMHGSESYGEMAERVERERLIREGSDPAATVIQDEDQGSPLDLAMSAKDHGFPYVCVHGERSRVGQLWHLDSQRADVVFEGGEQVTVHPSNVRIVAAGTGELDAVVPSKDDEDSRK